MAVVLAVNKTVGVVVAMAEAAVVSVALAATVTLAVVVLLAVASATRARPPCWPLPRLWPCRCGRRRGRGPGGCARDRRDRGRACEAGSFGAAARAAGRDGCQTRQERDADGTKLETDVCMC